MSFSIIAYEYNSLISFQTSNTIDPKLILVVFCLIYFLTLVECRFSFHSCATVFTHHQNAPLFFFFFSFTNFNCPNFTRPIMRKKERRNKEKTTFYYNLTFCVVLHMNLATIQSNFLFTCTSIN